MAAKSKATEAQSTLSLDNLQPAEGAVRGRLRVGRGRASGAGKTCNRGHNGEGQRSGNTHKRGFEGGQMPSYRRLPKFRTFPNPNKKVWLELNVGDLADRIPADVSDVTYEALIELGLLRNGMDGLRILGNGDLDRKLTIHAHHVTPSAKAKLEKAGCTLNLIEA